MSGESFGLNPIASKNFGTGGNGMVGKPGRQVISDNFLEEEDEDAEPGEIDARLL